MRPDTADFRRVLGHFVTGVTIVTTQDSLDRPVGLTANAFASVSLEPPLVLVCVDRTSNTHDVIAASGAFAVNILADGQEDVSRRFAAEGSAARFESVAWRRAATGSPILEGAIAWVDCRLEAAHDGGDHTIYVGAVIGADASAGVPLVFHRGGYGRLAP